MEETAFLYNMEMNLSFHKVSTREHGNVVEETNSSLSQRPSSPTPTQTLIFGLESSSRRGHLSTFVLCLCSHV